MAAEAAVPLFSTVADAVIASVSIGLVGDQLAAVTVRSGFGAGVPKIWNSATWPPGAPLLLLMTSWMFWYAPLTGMVTELPPEVGLNA